MKKLIAILFLATALGSCKKEDPKKEPRKANIYYTVSNPQGVTFVWHEIDGDVKTMGEYTSLYLEVEEGKSFRVNWRRCLCGNNNGPVTVKIHRQMPWGEYKVMVESMINTTQSHLEYFVDELVW
jgi:hypothetical protein